jgi:hypothetical protein
LGSTWDVRDALGFIASSGGKLAYLSVDQISNLRGILLKVREADAFLWVLRWLKNQKHCEPAIYEEVTRTASMRKKIEALNAGAAGAQYLSRSQKMSRAKDRHKRAAEQKGNVTPSAKA